ncbi:hypothetical protein ACFV4E_22420 [Streptomyces hygroscopicus]|uniref:Uncharacterized protein n=1 Tax=Streptomyces hygroscopicus TaxID=1912 RepID=A0ABQ3UFV4_STRHY|nr:hypothetical protein [Streptomyces hygroscopicus]GHJ34351.1 hypothetical protein TPA0910_87840 [Streptomyces hygroscopicus]GHJ34366.1 hypothetical protein TPA0910_87990 [Streptomyces hygroscopicus]
MPSKTSSSATSAWDDIQKRLDTLEPAVARFTICDDPELRRRLDEAKAELRDAEEVLRALTADDEQNRPLFTQRAETARVELDQAQAAFDARAVTLTFRALERQQLESLQAKHPASEQDEDRGDDFAMDSFAPALIAAASVEGMPVEYARKCLDTWSAADAQDLWRAAWGVQHQKRTDLGKG